MPTDLDDIFASVARAADAIPLRTAAQARRRGRQRSRNGIIAAAAAVCVVAGGIGVLAGPAQRPDNKTVAPTPSPSASVAPKTLAPLPQVGKPIPYGRTVAETQPVIVKDRVYTAWKVGTKIAVVAADLRTSEVLWRVEGFETGSELGAQVSATENAVLVSSGGGQTWVLDPADGKQRWDLTSSHLGEWVLHQQALVQRSSDSGQVDAYDLTTGRRLWSIAPAGNQVDKILGTRVHGQELLDDGYTDNHLVVVRRSGQVQVRDIVSGDVLRTMTPVSPPSDGNTLVAYEGKLYDGGPGCCDTEPYRVVVTDLGTGASKKVFTAKLEHTVGSMTVCGAWRVCLVDQESDTVSWVRAIDATSGQVVWSVPGPIGGSSLVANDTEMLVGGGDDGGTKLIDGNGREVFRTPDGQVEWLDGGRLLMLPRAAGGAVMTVNTVYGTVNQLGALGATAGPCTHTPDRLVCPTSQDVRIYQLRE